MGNLDRPVRHERPGFFDGQLLAASDLQGLGAYGSELRWLHNRSLHQPGIGNGFATSGAKGEREVVVGPGYAIDARGREIVLTTSERLAVPAVAAERDGSSVFFDLAISFADPETLKAAETREGVCLPRVAVLYREAPIFCWVRLQRDELGALKPVEAQLAIEIKEGMQILLARIEVLNCELRSAVSVVQRREARPRRLPNVVAGETMPDWRPWGTATGVLDVDLGDFETDFAYVYTAWIDTCRAGFASTPWYAAHVPGHRILEVKDDQAVGDDGDVVRRFLIVDQLHVQDSEPDGFTAFLAVAIVPLFDAPAHTTDPVPALVEGPGPPPAIAAGFGTPKASPLFRELTDEAADLIKATWRVSWMGVEQ
jgi:hypothetical protein